MQELAERIDRLGVPLDLIPDLLGTTETQFARWISGVLSPEESDIVEVSLIMLEIRLSRSAATH